MIGALGVVFGDIGTSPLYTFKVLFGLAHIPDLSRETVYGLTSLLLWILTLVVSVKYITFVMRASNKGEGGIMALVSLLANSSLKAKGFLIGLGLLGVALFYGDSVITPAISVLSAVEGLHVVAPHLNHWVVPLTLVILVTLFMLQRFGTGTIGKFFGPIMLLWFLAIGAAGLSQVWQHPDVLRSLSPLTGLVFAFHYPVAAFVALGGIILAMTGAEALYADMGHFGHAAISKTWFFIVFPALVLCYMGQAALLANSSSALQNPLYLLFPQVTRAAMIALATAATLIASQSVISGAFSLTRQAIQLHVLPRMTVRQTSELIGQIYLPFANALMLLMVAILVLTFGSSEKLAGAFGMAVSATLAIDTVLFSAVLYARKHNAFLVDCFAIVFLGLDVLLVLANVSKIPHGGWLPLTIAAFILLIINTWMRGRGLAAKQRIAMEPPLRTYISELRRKHSVARIPGQAVYIGHHKGLTPTALRTTVEDMHELHEKVMVVYVETSRHAHVPHNERIAYDELGHVDGISQVTITYGFHDTPNIPKSLEGLGRISPELAIDPHKAVYFISLSRPAVNHRHDMPFWQKALYVTLTRNALSTSDYYHLPVGNTVEIRTLLPI